MSIYTPGREPVRHLSHSIKLLTRHPKMTSLGDAAARTHVEGNSEGAAVVARAVQAAPSSSLVLPPGCFTVTCKNASMYGKKMRDVHIAGFSVESDKVIRFRSSDGKVAVGDLLVGVSKYVSVSKAQETIFKYMESKDNKIRDLDIEVDKKLSDVVCDSNLMIFLYSYQIIFKFFCIRSHMVSGTNLVPLILMVQNQI